MSVWDGVVVTPSEKAYEPPVEPKEGDEEQDNPGGKLEEGQEEKMEVQQQ